LPAPVSDMTKHRQIPKLSGSSMISLTQKWAEWVFHFTNQPSQARRKGWVTLHRRHPKGNSAAEVKHAPSILTCPESMLR